ncbi:hypothetical protein AB6A40_004336 [Gnathostoma spinigerum]|uniref:Uncharacterized protein n=1 Tax=Gnathostoma spinigerum TaxID=75299 RepID=A0ABD6ELN4_9BILA
MAVLVRRQDRKNRFNEANSGRQVGRLFECSERSLPLHIPLSNIAYAGPVVIHSARWQTDDVPTPETDTDDESGTNLHVRVLDEGHKVYDIGKDVDVIRE